MSASDYFETSLGNHVLRGVPYTMPAVIAIALFLSIPDDANEGGVEPAGVSYSRVHYGPSEILWLPPTNGDGKFINAYAITFPKPLEDWGPIIGIGIFDAFIDGNLLMVEALNTTKEILSGAPAPEFIPGSVRAIFS